MAAAGMFALLLSGCGDSQSAAGTSTAESAELAASQVEARRRPPVPPPCEFTQEELRELADSAEVKGLNSPWGAAPPSDKAIHITMSDGTRLALSLYFPPGFDASTSKVPVAYVETWYGRAVEATATAIDLYRAAGFAVAIADPRGFGASFGYQTGFMTPDVKRDQKEMLAWFAKQPWSNGKVAAVGMSISANQAEVVAASGAPNLRAAIIRASDFDHYESNMFPGGIANLGMLGMVEFVITWMRGEECVADLAACAAAGVAPVDGDSDLRLLQAAFGDHKANVRADVLRSSVFRDDPIGTGKVDDMSTIGNLAGLRAAAVPARISASWMDGTTAQSALSRFAALPDVPMELSIGATAHSGGVDADPFSRTPFGPARPSAAEQYAADVAFVGRVFAGQPIGRSISYYVLGSGMWKTTAAWPPAGVTNRSLKLTRSELVEQRQLPSSDSTDTRSGGRGGERRYDVDPAAAAGSSFSRWASQGGHVVYYGDRRVAVGQRLTFEGAPMERDSELVGAPELCLAMRTDQTDGTVFAYLEDIAPDGRITYLTEGELRLLHRKLGGSTEGAGCDPAPGTGRSFNRAAGTAVIPGELMRVEIPLQPTAALVRKGHRLRLSLAGADAGTFPMVTPAPGTWFVAHGGTDGSTLNVPMRSWSPR